MQVLSICNSYNLISKVEPSSISIWLTVISMSKIDEFESMIVVNLREGLDSGSTLVVDDELILSTISFW